MKQKICLCGLVMAIALVLGCEWESSDGDSSWNDRFNWVVVAGTYAPSSGALVALPGEGSGSGGGGGNDAPTIPVVNESDGTLAALQTDVSGDTDKVPVVPGSLTVVMKTSGGAGGSFVDDGSGKLTGYYNLAGADSPFDNLGAGNIVYETGKWNLSLQSGGFPLGSASIKLNYSYEDINVAVENQEEESSTAGGSVYSFVVSQQGDRITITDDRGGRYTGSLTGASSTSGNEDGSISGEVIAQFEVSGKAGDGHTSVTIVGSFTAYNEIGNSASARQLKNRTIRGTWMQNDGVTADVYGISATYTGSTSSSQ